MTGAYYPVDGGYLALRAAGVAPQIAGPVGMATIAELRLAAILRGLHLPVVPMREK